MNATTKILIEESTRVKKFLGLTGVELQVL